jgi:hypothetical protein
MFLKLSWLWIAVIVAAVLTACSGHAPTTPEEKQDDVTITQEQQLVFLFRLILKMDKNPSLAISKAQAAVWLPIASRSLAEGKLTKEEADSILAAFTGDQRSYYNEMTKDNNERIQKAEQFQEHPQNLTDEERSKLLNNLHERREKGGKGEKGEKGEKGDSEHKSDGDGASAEPEEARKSVEQRVVDLLQSKLGL